MHVCTVVHLQATCSEAEASKRLADALAAAEASQQALQEERNTTANLQQQLTALQEQLTQVRDLLPDNEASHVHCPVHRHAGMCVHDSICWVYGLMLTVSLPG